MNTKAVGFFTLATLAIALATSAALSGAANQQAAPPAAPAAGLPVRSSDAVGHPNNLQELLAMFRSSDNSFKVRTINGVLKLTSEEAQKFWPVYQRYEKEEQAQVDRRVSLIKEFVALSNAGKINNENAGKLAGEWLQLEQDRVDLWKKYNQEIGKAVSPLRAAQFLQVEHQLALLMDLNIAEAMPAVTDSK